MVRVAVGLLRDSAGRVLVNQRKRDGRHPGRWEFPGGKLEQGESERDALTRELHEELGIDIVDARKRIRVQHRYEDLLVELDVWDVMSWQGEVHAREGHQLRWRNIAALNEIDLLEADRPIVTSLRLASLCAVTPDAAEWACRSAESWLDAVVDQAPDQVAMIQLRLPGSSEQDYSTIAAEVAPLCRAKGISLFLNGEPRRMTDLARRVGAIGIQVPARFLSDTNNLRRDAGDLLLGASCHCTAELRLASELRADFALLGPVNATSSHPGLGPLSWSGFEKLVASMSIPVFAIGGVTPGDLDTAWAHGAQGVAGISAFWRGLETM